MNIITNENVRPQAAAQFHDAADALPVKLPRGPGFKMKPDAEDLEFSEPIRIVGLPF